MISRLSLRSLLLLGVTAVAFTHCRTVDLCGDGTAGCRFDAPAGSDGNPGEAGLGPDGRGDVGGQGGMLVVSSAGQAGEALGGHSGQPGIERAGGAAGEAGETEPVCTKPQANCDETPLNGCETNLSLDPNHCGACDSPCDGLCANSVCLPFEVLGKYDVQSNLAIGEQYLYFVSGEVFTSERLLRLDLVSKQQDTLAQNLPDVDHVALGADRVYLWSTAEGLWSVLNSSNRFVDEGVQLDWFGLNRENLFWLNSSELYRRGVGAAAGGETLWRKLSLPSYRVELAVDASELLVVEHGDTDVGESSRISTLRLDADTTTEPRLVVDERGEIVRWRLYDGTVYWIARYSEGGIAHDELRRADTSEGSKPELLLSAPRIEDFAVNHWVFAHCPTLPFHEIAAFDPSRPKQVHRLGIAAGPEHMEVDNQGRLWLFQSELERLLLADVSWLQ